MNRNLIIVLFIFLDFCISAQPAAQYRKRDPYKWMFGVSWNAIDDNGSAYTYLFDVEGSWNYEYFPTRIFIDKYIYKSWSFEGSAAFNRYTPSKLINDTTGLNGIFVCGDLNMKYSFNRYMKQMKWFDPYISAGVGVTYRDTRQFPVTPTVNVNIGANFWFSRKFGFQLQTAGKLAIVSDLYVSDADYTQHSIGLVYRFSPKKGSSSGYRKPQHKWTKDRKRFRRRGNAG